MKKTTLNALIKKATREDLQRMKATRSTPSATEKKEKAAFAAMRFARSKKNTNKSGIDWDDDGGRPRTSETKVSSDNTLEQAVTLVEDVQNFFNLNHVRKFITVGGELFDSFKPFMEKPTWWNAGRALMGLGKVAIDDAEVWSHSYFDSEDWTFPYSPDFNVTILQILAKFPYKTMKTADEGSVIRFCEVEGVRFGWVFNIKLESIDHIWVRVEQLEQAQKIIKDLLWNKFKNKPLVMRNNRGGAMHNEPRVVFEIDDAFHPLPSQRATEYSDYLKRCIAAEVPRSVMLYGPPGTGKSTLARTLVEHLDLRSFRIRVEDVSGVDSSTLFEAINIFEPDAVILDDFDRAHAQVQLLETLEFFQRHVKLVVATVNDMDSLDEALLRPGRFDELLEVDKMDEAVVMSVLGTYSDGFDAVKAWPIAFIQEYVKRRKFMKPEEAINATIELAQRVKRLDKYRQRGDVNRLLDAANVTVDASADDVGEGENEGEEATIPLVPLTFDKNIMNAVKRTRKKGKFRTWESIKASWTKRRR